MIKKISAKIKLLSIGVYLLAGLFLPAQAQQMWPGDANNNGRANVVDLLYIGIAYGQKGPSRPNASTRWQAQAFPLWPQSLPNGLNLGYIDGNGDGEIDDKDNKDAIETNYGLTHGIAQGDYPKGRPTSNGPRLFFSTPNTIVKPGAIIDVDIHLGDEKQPISNFYGLAFQASYTQNLVQNLEVEDLTQTWMDTPGEDTKNLFWEDPNSGRFDVAFTRVDQVSANGYGKIGRVKVVIEDIIVGKKVEILKFAIDSMLLTDPNLKSQLLRSDTLIIYVTEDPGLVTSTSKPTLDESRVLVYPNPNKARFWVKTAYPIHNWQLVDPLGRSSNLLPQKQAADLWFFDLPAISPGFYFLRGVSQGAQFNKKIIISRPAE
jgi:hypothetical protein